VRTVKVSKHGGVFRRALELIKNPAEPALGLPVPAEDEMDAYFVYQHSRELASSLTEFETQKAEIVEIIRRAFL
jgi:hypothetical protein